MPDWWDESFVRLFGPLTAPLLANMLADFHVGDAPIEVVVEPRCVFCGARHLSSVATVARVSFDDGHFVLTVRVSG